MSVTGKFKCFDCDNHFYEPEDALLRHLPEKYKHVLQYIQINGRTKLAINGHISNYIPNPTFEVVAAPGCHVEYYRGNNPDGKTLREFNVVERRKDEYAYKNERRYEFLRSHGFAGALVYPTLASVIEGHMSHDPGFCHAVIHALNQWIKEEWGFGDDGTFFAVPIIPLMDAELAVEEAQWIIDQGARVALIRPTYVPGIRGNRSMGASEFDPLWSLLTENKVFITFHASDCGVANDYNRFSREPVGAAEFTPFIKSDPLESVMDVHMRAVSDHLASMVCHGVFDRHPKLKVAYVETGVYWLFPLWDRLGHVYRMQPQNFKRHPHETIREHVWFHPFFEDDIYRLVDLVGADHVLFGSDWPHPEGIAVPGDWANEISDLSDEDQAKIMGGNIMQLLDIAA